MAPITATEFSIFDKRLSQGAAKLNVQLSKIDSIKGARFFKQDTIDSLTKDFNLFHGIGFAAHIPEGGDAQPQRPQIGKKKSITVRQFGAGMLFTRWSRKVTPELVAKHNRFLEDSKMKSQELGLANFYRYSIEGATVPTTNGRPVVDVFCETGLSYFNDGHTFEGSGATNSNLSAARRTLSQSAVLSMVHQGRGWVGYDGMPAGGNALGLVVGDDLPEEARVLLQSTLDPESANNANNVLKYTGVKTVEHWTMLPTSDFMMKFDVPSDNPGFLILWFEKGRAENYPSNSGNRYFYGYTYAWWFGGINPYEYLTNRAPEA